jgi:broad specificity phosphatase PhoE
VPRAERIGALVRRAESLWQRLVELADGGTGNLLCVTHSGILQWLVKVTFGHRRWMPLVPMGNCAISLFSVDNRPSGESVAAGRRVPDRRYYCEWSLLNYRPALEASPGAGPEVGHVFLEP